MRCDELGVRLAGGKRPARSAYTFMLGVDEGDALNDSAPDREALCDSDADALSEMDGSESGSVTCIDCDDDALGDADTLEETEMDSRKSPIADALLDDEYDELCSPD